MSSDTLPKFVEIANTKSFWTRKGLPAPDEKSIGSGSVANLSRNAEAMTRSRPSNLAFSATMTDTSGFVFIATTKLFSNAQFVP